VASGTVIINELGDAHVQTGKPIVYTSADSVFQIAAHEETFGLERLYEVSEVARAMLTGDHCVGRVIARPFVGPDDNGVYQRTHRRRDYAVKPFEPTVLDLLQERGVPVFGVGKIGDIFAWQGVTSSPHVTDNMDGFTKLVEEVAGPEQGFVFTNLVDFDMLWGHRNDARAYADGLEAVDARMPELLDAMVEGDLLIITADHGCDPTTSSTDHSREHTPLIAKVKGVDAGVDLGTRATFGDIGETVLDFYGLADRCGRGKSFLSEVREAR
jgi:phosphopentomutase